MSKQEKKPVSPARRRQNRVILFCAVLLVLTVAFVNIRGLANSYYDSFVRRGVDVEEAVSYLQTAAQPGDSPELAQLQADWDSWRYSRLRESVTVTARDGVELHGYLYDEGSDVTAICIPRFNGTGLDDLLMGPWLNAETGCNILLLDPRAHGESGGDYFSYGWKESEDLVCWLDWADETLGKQTYLLWGEGCGANTILFAAAAGSLDGRAAYAVAESPYASFHQEASHILWSRYRLPEFPFLTLMRWRLDHDGLGFTSGDMELSAALSGKDCSVPVLFLSSAEDAYIPVEQTQAVYDLYSGPKEQLQGGAGHGTVVISCQEELQAMLAQWNGQYVDAGG